MRCLSSIPFKGGQNNTILESFFKQKQKNINEKTFKQKEKTKTNHDFRVLYFTIFGREYVPYYPLGAEKNKK